MSITSPSGPARNGGQVGRSTAEEACPQLESLAWPQGEQLADTSGEGGTR
jgi:hypothetical protein